MIRTPRLHQDQRGRLAELLRTDVLGREIRQVYVVTIAPGAHRAEHFHKTKTEWICVLQGECIVRLVDPKSGMEERVPLDGSQWHVLEIPPEIHHTLYNGSLREALAIVGSDHVHDPNDPDVHHLPVSRSSGLATHQ